MKDLFISSVLIVKTAMPTPPPITTDFPEPERVADKNGYYHLGHTTLYYLILEYGFPAMILFFIEVLLLGAAAGGNILPPFSEMVTSNTTVASAVREAINIVPVFAFIALTIALIMAFGSYFSFRYKIEENYLSFLEGIFNRRKISIPFFQIQNVDIEQNIVHHILGLARLVILTTGHQDPKHSKTEESEISIPALNIGEGLRLQKYLLDHSNIQKILTQDPAKELDAAAIEIEKIIHNPK